MTRIHQVIELLLWLILFIPRLRLSPDEVPPLFPLPLLIPIDFDSGTLYIIYIMYYTNDEAFCCIYCMHDLVVYYYLSIARTRSSNCKDEKS